VCRRHREKRIEKRIEKRTMTYCGSGQQHRQLLRATQEYRQEFFFHPFRTHARRLRARLTRMYSTRSTAPAKSNLN
jgi:hypothetical protein